MNKPKPVIALNLPETGLEPELRDYFRVCQEKLGFVPNVLKAYAFDNMKLKAFIDMVGDLMLGESGVSRLDRELIAVAVSAVSRGIDYLFKLRQTKNVKALIERAFQKDGRHNAGQGWQGRMESSRLMGWSRSRHAIVLRRRLKGSVMASTAGDQNQLRLSFAEIGEDTALWEYAVLVTSLNEEVLSIAQLYRDRADCENAFDELKNQWGWGGFKTRGPAALETPAGHVPDAIVAGDLAHAEQALAIRTPMPIFQPPLVGQKRGALHEKYRKRGHAEIRHAVLAVRAPAPVRKRLKTGSQYVEQVLHWPHCHSESDSTAAVDPTRAPESMCRTAAGGSFILNCWRGSPPVAILVPVSSFQLAPASRCVSFVLAVKNGIGQIPNGAIHGCIQN